MNSQTEGKMFDDDYLERIKRARKSLEEKGIKREDLSPLAEEVLYPTCLDGVKRVDIPLSPAKRKTTVHST